MKKSTVYFLTLEDIKDENILFNHIYANENSNFYISDDLSKDFYINQALCGFISTSVNIKNQFYLLPEMQFEYAILDFKNLHISKKVKKLLKKNDFIFTINKNLDEVVRNIQLQHKTNWLSSEYHKILKDLQEYKHPNIDFRLMTIEIWDRNSNTGWATSGWYDCDISPDETIRIMCQGNSDSGDAKVIRGCRIAEVEWAD